VNGAAGCAGRPVLHVRGEPGIKVNAACPGWCDTDLSNHMGPSPAAQGARIAVMPATLGDDGPTGGFHDDDGIVAW